MPLVSSWKTVQPSSQEQVDLSKGQSYSSKKAKKPTSSWTSGVKGTPSLVKNRQGTILGKSVLTIGHNNEAPRISLNDGRVSADSNKSKLNSIKQKIDVQFDKAVGKLKNKLSKKIDKFRTEEVKKFFTNTLVFNQNTTSYVVKDNPDDLDDPGRQIHTTHTELKGNLHAKKITKYSDSTITSTKIYSNAKLIGEGLSGYIFTINAGAKELILKLEKFEQSSLRAGDEILNKLLGKKKKVTGLVEKNKAIIEVEKDGKKITGVLQKKYKGDVENREIHELSTKAKLNIFSDLAKGVRYLHQKNFHHGDIKPKNIFYEIKNGWFKQEHKAVIADLDDGIFMDEEVNKDGKVKKYDPTFTMGYFHADDMKRKNRIATHYSNGLEINEDDKKFLNAIDVYALGASYKYMLFKEPPQMEDMYIISKLTHEPEGTSKITPEQAEANKIPKKAMNFINRMIDPNWSNRPSMREVDQFFKKYASNSVIPF